MWVRCYERYDSSPFPFTLVTHCTHRSSFPEYFTVLVPYLDQLRCSGLLVGKLAFIHTHTHSKNIALHLLRNTQLRGKRLFFGLSHGKRAVENEGGLWHGKKLGSLVSCCSNIRRADGDCHTDKNSSRPLLCNPLWPIRTNRLIKVNLQQPFENFLPRKCKQINLNVLITFFTILLNVYLNIWDFCDISLQVPVTFNYSIFSTICSLKINTSVQL